MRKTVCLLISGGIDSAIAAHVLLQNGYNVHALHLHLFPSDSVSQDKARKIASFFDIPFTVLDVQDRFSSCVIQTTLQSYQAGVTPNPCILCNPDIKFGEQVQRFASEHSLQYIATGHYANIQEEQGFSYLSKAKDASKDQSYFLYRVPSSLYPTLLFPLGGLYKSEVKEMARAIGLSQDTISKESNDLCFYEGSYRDFAKEHLPLQKGDIVSIDGEKLGMHDGYSLYTIGQRQGLGVSYSEPLYVNTLDASQNQVCLATRQQMMSSSFTLKNAVWNLSAEESLPTKLAVKIRYRSLEASCTIQNTPPYEVQLHQPMFAITPGQSAVFYAGHRLLGGGFIA
ncbi:MAG: tRNA 2-thiouridine(34) synthase MnmA [Caldisericia bacterium]|nr:tRNA 2-thiouridine(34) synthase MnmA [Caldisericia bacterium]